MTEQPILALPESHYLSFTLPEAFVAEYADKRPEWGFPIGGDDSLAELVYVDKYSALKEDGTKERWHETVKRCIEGYYSILKDHCKANRTPWNDFKALASAKDAYDRMWNFKWLPPGRGLQHMGRPIVHAEQNSAALQNPLHEDTSVLTREGWKRLGDLEGTVVEVLTSAHLYGRESADAKNFTSKWVKADISMIEYQPSVKIEYRTTLGEVKSIVASRNHRWFTKNAHHHNWKRVTSEELEVEGFLPTVRPHKNFLPSLVGMQHGFFFGDGSRNTGELEQFGASVAVLSHLFGHHVQYRDRCGWVGQLPLEWGKIPSDGYAEDQRYMYGFLAGYFAADGCVGREGHMTLSSARPAELREVQRIFLDLGIEASEPKLTSTSSNYAEERELWTMRINRFDLTEEFFLLQHHRERWLASTYGKSRTKKYARIISVEDAGVQPVLCATVPEYEQFVTEDFILTSNCGFISTEKLSSHSVVEATGPFQMMMEMSMWGIGVGYDLKGAGNLTIHEPNIEKTETWVVPDNREGWAESVAKLLETYFFKNRPVIVFDYSEIRPSGEPLKRFGGRASGPGPLVTLHESLRSQYEKRTGEMITSRDILDTMNKIGKAVVAGGARRSAQICFGDPEDTDYVTAKNWNLPENAERTDPDTGWAWNCLTEDAWIQTDEGPRQILDLLEGPFIALVDGKPYQASGFVKTGDQVPIFNLTTKQGYSLRATGNHPFMTDDGWKKLEDLQIGELVHLNHHQNLDWDGLGNWNEGYLLGHLWGDGTLVKGTGQGVRAVLSLFGEENTPEWQSEIEMMVASLDSPARFYSVNDGAEARIGSKIIGKLAAFYGMTIGNKKFADTVEYASSVFYRGLLRGVFDTDGYVQSNGDKKGFSVILSQSDREQLELIQRMLLRLGIKSSIRQGMKGGRREVVGRMVNCSDAWTLAIGSESADTFVKEIGFSNPLKARKADSLHTSGRRSLKFVAKIESIESCGHADVFDTTVEDVHAFDANGFVVHNSNNSVFVEPGTDYAPMVQSIIDGGGEPGFMWMGLARDYGRLVDPANFKDHRAAGGNPCLEQTLEHMELCTLVETFPSKHETFADYRDTLKHAYLYGKAVTLMPTKWPETNEVMQRNRRIGCSPSGLAEFVESRGWAELRSWMDEGYKFVQHRDEKYSEWLAVRESIKKTSVKPSGTVSIVAGVTPGVHWPVASGHYMRRIRYSVNNPMVETLREAGYHVEPANGDKENTVVVTFITKGPDVRNEREVTVWEKAELAVLLQRWWADNQVSATLTFLPEERDQLLPLLASKDGQFKGVSFLPLGEAATYPQQPYERITDSDSQIQACLDVYKPLGDIYATGVEAVGDKFCDNSTCTI